MRPVKNEHLGRFIDKLEKKHVPREHDYKVFEGWQIPESTRA